MAPRDTSIVERLDTRGTFCPVPILLTARRFKLLAPGAQLEVLGDDPGILEDMPVWCDQTGNILVSMLQDKGEVCCIVEKAGGGRTDA